MPDGLVAKTPSKFLENWIIHLGRSFFGEEGADYIKKQV